MRFGARLAAAALLALPVLAQDPGRGPSAPTAPAPAAQQDTTSGSTPRSTLDGYLVAARWTDYVRAASYLDLSRSPGGQRSPEGPVLARHLKVVLDHNLWIDVESISDLPEGTLDDGLPANVEHIGTIHSSQGRVEIVLRRLPGDEGVPEWKFSSSLVERIPALYEEFGYGWIGEHVPERLQRMRFVHLEAWQALGLLAFLIASIGLGWAGSLAVIRIAKPIAARTQTPVDDRLLDTMRRPLRWGIALVALAIAVRWLHLSVKAAAWVDRGLAAIAFTTAVVAVMAVVDAFAQTTRERLVAEGQKSGAGVVHVVSRAVKVLLGCIAIIGILQAMGFNVTTLLAGLGIGGVAVALAAQKTVENLFGGLTVMADKPVKIGDFCRFGDKSGWVEDFGFRSTRIRTLERSLISIPNAEFSSVQIENLSERDRIRFFATVSLRYETTPDQLRAVLVELRKLFIGHPKIAPDQRRVRFIQLGPASLDVEIQTYVMTSDADEFYAVREDLLLRMMDVVAASGTGFAFPSQTIYMARDGGLDPAKTAGVEEQIRALREERKLPFPDFAPAEIDELSDRLDYPPQGSSTAPPPVTPS